MPHKETQEINSDTTIHIIHFQYLMSANYSIDILK